MNYSPLRYPGGKAKFSSYIKAIIKDHSPQIETYIEPFAGGAGVALELLFSGVVKRIVINDYDKAIYAFWRAVLEESDKLIQLIRETDISVEEWYKQRKIYQTCSNKYSIELAFAAFYLNRTNRSGILNAGPIGGYAQNGNYLIDARYNKQELIRRIENIAQKRKYIRVYNKEIRPFISQILSQYDINTFVYLDPPYLQKGKRLYKNSLSIEDHREIAEYIRNKVSCDWVITYDETEEIKNIYKDKYYRIYELPYSVVKSNKKREIIIFKDKQLCPNYETLSENNVKFI